MNERITGQMKGQIDCKRFYMPGVRVHSECPKCGKHFDNEFEGDSFNNPFANEPEKLYFYCDHCNEEWQVPVILKVSLEIISNG